MTATITAPSATTLREAAETEILANMYRAVVDEMANVLLRSSHTTFVKETQDFSTGLVTPGGDVFAAPVTLGATPLVGIPMAAGTEAIDTWHDGDVLITNDPYQTGGMVMHLNDIYSFAPVIRDGEVVCFAWAFIHCTDVGGAVPGSIDMQNTSIFQEGLRIRPIRLVNQGVVDESLWHLIADNSRIPDVNWGDVTALLSALKVGVQRAHSLIDRYGLDSFTNAMTRTIATTRETAKSVFRSIPAGAYSFVEYLEDDYNSETPVRLAVCLSVTDGGDVTLDFEGSDPQVKAAINLPSGNSEHHPFLSLAMVNYAMTHAKSIHYNAGIVQAVTLKLPENSVVNASFPAPVGMRYSTACRIHEAVLGALNKAVPDRVPAGGSSQLVVTYISTEDTADQGGSVIVANSLQGGTGGGLGLDGEDGIDYPAAFLRNVPVETLESEADVLVQRLELRHDSAGAGEHRGGFGVEYSITLERPGTTVVMRGKDRHRYTAFGTNGGLAGTTAGCIVESRDGTKVDIGKRAVHEAKYGDTIHLWTGGGGGKGHPFDRPADSVVADVLDGLMSPQRAAGDYGVHLSPTGEIDRDATAVSRQQRSERSLFDVGEARAQWENLYNDAAEYLARMLPHIPAGLRRTVQTDFYRLCQEHIPQDLSADVLEEFWNTLLESHHQ